MRAGDIVLVKHLDEDGYRGSYNGIESNIWQVALFTREFKADEDCDHVRYLANGHLWRYCLPLKGNEYLAGTDETVDNDLKDLIGEIKAEIATL